MSPGLVSRIGLALADAAKLPGNDRTRALLGRSRRPEHGDYATSAAMRIACETKRPAHDIAVELARTLSIHKDIASVEVAGAGFVNIKVADSSRAAVVAEVLAAGNDYGRSTAQKSSILLEFVSANPTGPLHVGHGRAAAIGDSLARILRFAGAEVTTEYFMNDRGRQTEVLAASLWLRVLMKLVENTQAMPKGSYEGGYLSDIADAYLISEKIKILITSILNNSLLEELISVVDLSGLVGQDSLMPVKQNNFDVKKLKRQLKKDFDAVMREMSFNDCKKIRSFDIENFSAEHVRGYLTKSVHKFFLLEYVGLLVKNNFNIGKSEKKYFEYFRKLGVKIRSSDKADLPKIYAEIANHPALADKNIYGDKVGEDVAMIIAEFIAYEDSDLKLIQNVCSKFRDISYVATRSKMQQNIEDIIFDSPSDDEEMSSFVRQAMALDMRKLNIGQYIKKRFCQPSEIYNKYERAYLTKIVFEYIDFEKIKSIIKIKIATSLQAANLKYFSKGLQVSGCWAHSDLRGQTDEFVETYFDTEKFMIIAAVYISVVMREETSSDDEKVNSAGFEQPGESYRELDVGSLPDDQDKAATELVLRVRKQLGKKSFDALRDFAVNAMRSQIKEELGNCRVVHNTWFSERKMVDSGMVEKALAELECMGSVYEADGARWFRASEHDDVKDRVLVRSDGEHTYFASDIAYHLDKFKRGYDRQITLLGSDHHGYVPRLRGFVSALGRDPALVELLLIQFVSLVRGGRRVKMSTRGGEFATLAKLVEAVGVDAARLFFVAQKADSHMDFDIDLALRRDSENPLYYVQYAHARCRSLLAKWGGDTRELKGAQPTHVGEPSARALLAELAWFPEAVAGSARERAPHMLWHHLYELARRLHAFYDGVPVLAGERDARLSRLSLAAAARQCLANGLQLLGVDAPAMM